MTASEWGIGQEPSPAHWLQRVGRWLFKRLRPQLGWMVFCLTLALTLIPALAFRDAEWVNLRIAHFPPELLLLVAVVTIWWGRSGLRSATPGQRGLSKAAQMGQAIGIWFITGAVGLLTISQLLTGWIPSPLALGRALVNQNWPILATQMGGDLERLTQRILFWWQGVTAGGANQDDLIFLGLAGLLLYFSAALTAWLVLTLRRGLAAALPTIWLLAMVLYYSQGGRAYLAAALLITLALQLWLDQLGLYARWEEANIDYSRDLIQDRLLAAANIALLVLALTLVAPNIVIEPVVQAYYDLMAPVDKQTVDVGKRLFPDLERGFYGRGGVSLTGLPNSFLLGSGPELSQALIMRVRTSDSDYQPQGHYMRGAALTLYNGRGWDNPGTLRSLRFEADQPWTAAERPGRRILWQSVSLAVSAPVLFAAPEAVEVSTPARLETQTSGDLVAIWANERDYTVRSSIPAVSEEELLAQRGWGGDLPLPGALRDLLQLPGSITPRTRDLARQLTENLDTPYAKAQAIEAYLRQYPYDLSIDKPPPEIEDVADYFLFDLQRGYCDYYATAFVTLARLAGLPARFATGYAVGSWNEFEMEWEITEAQAHSWPEIYFPVYGWIPFEPTAGRPQLERRGRLELGDLTAPTPDLAAAKPEEASGTGLVWNWQMLFWLLPGSLLIWAGIAFYWGRHRRRMDPWLALLWWGLRLGRGAQDGETEQEYGLALASHLAHRPSRNPEQLRTVTRQVVALSGDASRIHYGPPDQRATRLRQIRSAWPRLRNNLWRIWLRNR